MRKKIEILVDEDCLIKEMIKKKTSRKFSRYLKNHNYLILVNNISSSNHEKIFKGDILTIIYDTENIINANDLNLNLNIIYEDEYIMIINKPYDLQTIPSKKDNYKSLYNAIIHYYKQSEMRNTIHFINRLDQPTQGLVLVAKDKYTALLLSDNIKNIKRSYLALCKGVLDNKQGKIETNLIKDELTGKRVVDFNNGKKAITNYRVIKEDNNSLIEIDLETGRTHQIRCHMSYLGHSIVGDKLYGDEDGYLHLCSYKIEFIHPFNQEKMSFKIEPEWLKE